MRLLLALLPALALAQPPYDVLIKNGRIADGTGNPTFLADLALTGGKITAIGKLNGLAKRTIDATGMIVAPGFIDIHNHSDTSLLADGNAQSFIRQGVTTLIFGEGPSAAPSRDFPRFTNY
jgi:N-acyl-D-aspartate/D-glutamate deacylase